MNVSNPKTFCICGTGLGLYALNTQLLDIHHGRQSLQCDSLESAAHAT